MVDKIYCMSSYLALRYVEKSNREFFSGIPYNKDKTKEYERQLVYSANDIDQAIEKEIMHIKKNNEKIGLFLSGGMDSAILASYLKGCDAYTFRFLNGNYQREELERAEFYADYYGLSLHYVDITWDSVDNNIDKVMRVKGGPVHSIEPQLYQGAVQAKKDGVEVVIIGNGSDYVFGGMDGLLSKDWDFDEFVERYVYINPKDALHEYVSMDYVFERYRNGNKIDFLKLMDDVATEESYSSYQNAFKAANMLFFDPYVKLKMGDELDLARIRNGESKYLIRELFRKKYPQIKVPEKVPMPRPVDEYFKDWTGPKRTEFRKDIDMKSFSGNQKWQLYCLERFLNMIES